MGDIGVKLHNYTRTRNVAVGSLPIPEATELQIILNRIGYPLPQPFNGIVGDLTRQAWAKFKKDNYLRDPDLIGASSVAKLIKTFDKAKSATKPDSKPSIPDLVIETVPFYPQTDNAVQPDRTCNTSSCAMVASELGVTISDDAYWKIVNKYGDTTDHGAQTSALEEIGIKSDWYTDLDFVDLDQSLQKRIPVVIGILHRGDTSAPTGGHMIVILGKASDGSYYIAHDPYGNLLDGYTTDVYNGKFVKYPTWQLMKRWTAEGKNSGWGRLFKPLPAKS